MNRIEIRHDQDHLVLAPSSPLVQPYIASAGLIEAVNLAMFLGRPLLIQGEPGCGKTTLGKAVAAHLYPDAKDPDQLPYYEWRVRSSSKSQDGRYAFDHLRRLHDVQVVKGEDSDTLIANAERYITKGPLWKSFESEIRAVLVIDEIDKADIDFPNDLLEEMDKFSFEVPEWVENEKPVRVPREGRGQRPLVIITSNREKELPDAFLRRCIYYYIPFPGRKELEEIVIAHLGEKKGSKEEMKAVVEAFLRVRKSMEHDRGRVDTKKVATSELLDWCEVIFAEMDGPKQLDKLLQIPFRSVLLKSFDDHQSHLYQRDFLEKVKIDE